jgi:cytosine/adenosine deaminase-related metal-dependent hydrolase
MARTLIRHATVVSMDPAVGDFQDADILIEGEKILAIRPNIEAADAAEIDARGRIAIPGFIDTHRHTWQCLLRNAAADWSLPQYFSGVRGVMGELYTPDDMLVANRLGALEALNAGITTLYDWSHNNNSPEHADAAVEGLRAAGIRAIFGYGNANREWFVPSELPMNLADAARLRRGTLALDDALVTMALAPRGPQYTTLDLTEQEFRRARDLGLRITMHVGDGLWGTGRPVAALHARGLLAADTTYVHCNTLADDENKLIADTGGTASIAPEVELNMGHGNLATMALLRHGCRPGISIDVCCSVGGEMFTQMRVLMAATRGAAHAEAMARRAFVDPLPVNTRDVLEFATLQGARACGLEHKTGSLTPGKQADIVLLDATALNMFPVNNPIGAVVNDAHVGNVETVLVAGRVLKRDGELVGVDMAALRGRTEAAVSALFARAGAPRDGTWLPPLYRAGADTAPA